MCSTLLHLKCIYLGLTHSLYIVLYIRNKYGLRMLSSVSHTYLK